jgi:hypothetical protein
MHFPLRSTASIVRPERNVVILPGDCFPITHDFGTRARMIVLSRAHSSR